MKEIDMSCDIDLLNLLLCNAIMNAVQLSIPRKGGKSKRELVPWWTKDCDQAIHSRNKSFKNLKRNLDFQNLI